MEHVVRMNPSTPPPLVAAACPKCGREVDIPADGPGRVETVTECDKGGTCVYTRRPDETRQ